VEEFAAAAAAFLDDAPHPTLGGRLRDGWYVPMVELLRFLEGHGFTCGWTVVSIKDDWARVFAGG
jgi:hypothetical protein